MSKTTKFDVKNKVETSKYVPKASKTPREEILNLIRQGTNSCKEIRKKLRLERGSFWYHKQILIKSGAVKEEGGKLKIVLEPDKIAKKEHTQTILERIKSENPLIRELGIEELRRLSAEKLITDFELHEFVVKAIERDDYSDFKIRLQDCLLNIMKHAIGTKFENEFFSFVPANSLVEIALNTKNNENIRVRAIGILTKMGEFSILPRLLVEPEETFRNIHSTTYEMFVEDMTKHQQEARDKLYSLLDQYSGNQEIARRIYRYLWDSLNLIKSMYLTF